MGMLFIAVGFSIGYLLSVAALAKSRAGAGGVALFSLGTMLFFGIFFSAALVLQSLTTFFLALLCKATRAGARATIACATVAAIGSFALVLAWRATDLQRVGELRRQYPLESIAERLAFETPHAHVLSGDGAATVFSNEVEARLRKAEEMQELGSYRSDRLRRLHDRTTDEFVLAQGFGPVRMAALAPTQIELPSGSWEVPCGHTRPDQEPTPQATSWDQVASKPSRSQIIETHDHGLLDLLNPNRMGYVRDRQHVAGFQPHQFTSVPKVSMPGRESSWQIVRMELVGLLRHDSPVAYVTRQLPRMDTIAKVPTRALDAFEQDAVEQLRINRDVVIDEASRQIRMVGALRANRACLDCHAARRGELLGAISYDLAPRDQAPLPADQGPHAGLHEPRDLAIR